jgi:uncharacterized protein YxjI
MDRAHAKGTDVSNAAARHLALDPTFEIFDADAVFGMLPNKVAVIQAWQRFVIVLDDLRAQAGGQFAEFVRFLQKVIATKIEVARKLLEIIENFFEFERMQITES